MNEHEATSDSKLVPHPLGELAAPQIWQNRILGDMVEAALVLGRQGAAVRPARFRIGDYTWCDPDYRQILMWAEALKMQPITVIEKLTASKESKEVATRFQDGRMVSVSWDLDELPL